MVKSVFKVNVGKMKPLLVILGWSVCLAGFAMTAILAGIAFPRALNGITGSAVAGQTIYYVGILGVSLIAGTMLANIGKALLAFLASYTIGILLTMTALLIPWWFGPAPEAFAEQTAISLIFAAFFPIPLFLGMIGGIIGSATTEL